MKNTKLILLKIVLLVFVVEFFIMIVLDYVALSPLLGTLLDSTAISLAAFYFMRCHSNIMSFTQSKFTNFAAQVPDSIIITDLDGKITYVNPAFEKTTGYTLSEAVGKNPNILKSGKHDALFYRNMWQTLISGQFWRGQIINKKNDGAHYTEEGVIFPVIDEKGKPVEFVGIWKDITDKLLAEEKILKVSEQLLQAQKMEAIGLLAGGVAHDMNNMLSVVLGYSSLAINKMRESDPLFNDLQQISISATRAADIIRQLLLFSRKQSMEFRSLTLNETINNLLKMLTRLIGEDFSIESELEPDIWTMRGDAGTLEQVIMNLSVNARDAMPQQGGRIIIKTENIHIDEEYCKTFKYARIGQFVCLSVSDNGTGMSQETMQRIFEPFFTTKGVGKGTGLGLSVVYGIVKQHQGWINVFSEVGNGTTFKAYFPSTAIKAESRVHEKVLLETLKGNGECVLVVEDHKALQELIHDILNLNGYKPLIAANAWQAEQLFEDNKGKIRIIVSDVILPDYSGPKLIDNLLKRRGKFPVIFTSGYSDDKLNWEIIRKANFHFLQKPYSPETLLKTIKEMLKKGEQK